MLRDVVQAAAPEPVPAPAPAGAVVWASTEEGEEGVGGDSWGGDGDDWGAAADSWASPAETAPAPSPAEPPTPRCVAAASAHWACRKLVLEDEPSHAPASSDARVEALYQAYLASEHGAEDAGSLPPTAGQAGDSEGSDDEGDSAGREEQLFRRRLAAAPRQVLRYAWEGQPLWPTRPPVAGSLLGGSQGAHSHGLSPPPCPCGAPRVFECQLMPPLLSALDVDAGSRVHAAPPSVLAALQDAVVGDDESGGDSSASAAAASGQGGAGAGDGGGLSGVEGAGMDWSAVLVYACQASCSQGKSEYAVVLPA